MTVAKLRGYLDAYGIKPKSEVEKDDLIDAIVTWTAANIATVGKQEK